MSYQDRTRRPVVATLTYRTRRMLAGTLVSYDRICTHEVMLSNGDAGAVPMPALHTRDGETLVVLCCSDCHDYIGWAPDAQAR